MRNNVILFHKFEISDKLYIYKPVNVISGQFEESLEKTIFRDDYKTVYLNVKDLTNEDHKVTIGIGYPLTDEELLSKYPNNENNLVEAKEDYLLDSESKIFINFEDEEYCIATEELKNNTNEKLNHVIGAIDKALKTNNLNDIKPMLTNLKEDITTNDKNFKNENIEVHNKLLDKIKEESKSIYPQWINNENCEEINDEMNSSDCINQTLQKKDIYMSEIREPLERLNNMVGLKNVKDEINKQVNYLLFKEMTKGNLKLKDLNFNMLLTGNPGTGKTTVASIFADILCKLGYIKNNKVRVIGAHDLIDDHIGGTSKKTEKLLKECKGGIIIIDEAYVLVDGPEKFCNDVLGLILPEMQKKETIFIFAGYEREMKRFVEFNSGLVSRIGIELNFADYTLDQLYTMLLNKVNDVNKENAKSRLHFTEGALKEVRNIIEIAMQNQNFGNARFIENLIDKIIREKSSVIRNLDDINSIEELEELLYTITEDDIPTYLYEKPKEKKITLGFQYKKK